MSNLRTISVSLQAKLDADVQEPGYLVEMDLPTATLRLSSRADLTWGGQVWVSWDLDVSGLGTDGRGDISGDLRLGNSDNSMSAWLLAAEGISGRAVRIWVFYSDSPGADDAQLVFDGIANDVGINADRCSIQIMGDSLVTLALPRGRITPAAGFNHLTPENTVLVWGTQRIVLESAHG